MFTPGQKQSVREKLGEFLREKESGAAWDAHGEGLLAAFEAVCPEDARALEEQVRRRREEERLDEAAARGRFTLRKDKMERYGVEGLVASILQLKPSRSARLRISSTTASGRRS